MALTVGATHALSGTGQVAIATPVGLSIATAGIPGWVARAPGTPTTYRGLGKLSLGHALGWQAPVDLELVPQLVYPLPAEYTLLGYTFLAGLTVTVGELVAPAPLNSSLAPWDRNPAFWSQEAAPGIGGTLGDTTGWTYTVPAGRKLALSHIAAWVLRASAGTSLTFAWVEVIVGGVIMVFTELTSNVTGDRSDADWGGGPIILGAGTVLSGHYATTFTGGSVAAFVAASGYLFDA